MRYLIASSPHYSDSLAVGAVIDALVQTAAGEIITLYLAHSGGACEIAGRICRESVDAGLEIEEWAGEAVDRVFVWTDGDVAPPVAVPLSGRITVFGNVLSSERSKTGFGSGLEP